MNWRSGASAAIAITALGAQAIASDDPPGYDRLLAELGAPLFRSREMPVWGEQFGAEVPASGSRGNVASLVEHMKSLLQPPLAPRKKAPAP